MPECIIKAAEGVYYPREDSYLLAKAVEKYAFGDVLDIGTGSGIQGITAAKKGCKVTFADTEQRALDSAMKNAAANSVSGTFIKSNMFYNVSGIFDTIVFNPPYLPSGKTKDVALDGGKEGREFIERFLIGYREHLKPNGIALLLESSFNDYEYDMKLQNAELVEKDHYFFEDLVVLLLR